MSMLLSAQSLSKSHGSRVLFEGISLIVAEGDRIGVFGPNGAGKSTLMRILAGIDAPDDGRIETAKGARVAYVPQEDSLPADATVEGTLIGALAGEDLDDHARAAQARVMAGRLGFPGGDAEVGTLSGGWRKRLAVGTQLVRRPDLLILDEPTNHLDMSGLLWLERFLQKADFTFILVSHDRYLLEAVVSRVVELNPRYKESFFSVRGRYSDFLEKREARLAAQEKRERSLAIEVRREIEWLRRGPKARATKANYRIKSAGRKIDDLADLRRRIGRDPSVEIDFSATRRRSNDLLVAQGISKSMGGKLLFADLDFVLSPGSRLGIVGNNGSGKTTLLRVIAGDLASDTGGVKRVGGLRVALFDQARERLDMTATLRRSLAPSGDTIQFRGKALNVAGWAKRFLFLGDQLDMPVGGLSGGEQARVMIARMMLEPADLLLLDEPTNDLDIPAIEVLERSLDEFPGAVVLITHDRHMLDRLCTEIVGLHEGAPCGLYGDLSQWQRREDELRRNRPARAGKRVPRRAPRKSARAGLTLAEERELQNIEEAILAAEATLDHLKRGLADPALAANHVRMREYCRQLDAAQARLDSLYLRWDKLEAQRERG